MRRLFALAQVRNIQKPPEINNSIKMEVGIEDCLHIEFEYAKSKYHLKARPQSAAHLVRVSSVGIAYTHSFPCPAHAVLYGTGGLASLWFVYLSPLLPPAHLCAGCGCGENFLLACAYKDKAHGN